MNWTCHSEAHSAEESLLTDCTADQEEILRSLALPAAYGGGARWATLAHAVSRSSGAPGGMTLQRDREL
jgi:hypothetical protein